MVLHDQHIHSNYSEDSKQEIEEYYKLASKLGCKYFITTEHIDFDIGGSKTNWLVDFDSLIKKLKQLENATGPKMLLGVELGYRKDQIKNLNKILESQVFDLVNLSIHDNGIIEYYFVDGFKKYGIKETMVDYYNNMKEAIKTMDNFDVLSHLDYGFKTAYKTDETYDFFSDKEYIIDILLLLIKKGKALEINTKVQESLPDSHIVSLLQLYKELGGKKLTLSSDAHKIDRYLSNFTKYKKIIKDAGFNYLCYYIKRCEYHYDI